MCIENPYRSDHQKYHNDWHLKEQQPQQQFL